MNHTDRWQPYIAPGLGLLGSILVAVIALYSVHKSNGTNERAITAADEREREKWYRDNLLKICSEAVRISREISHHYNDAASVSLKLANPADFDEAFSAYMDAAQTAIGKVAPLAYDMMLLGELGLAMEFQEVRQAGEFVRPAFVQYHRYLVENFTRIEAARQEGGEALKDSNTEVQASLAFKRYSKAMRHLERVQVRFQFAAQRKISPGSLPEGELPSLDEDLPPLPPEVQNPFRRLSNLDWDKGDTADPLPEETTSPAEQKD
ncbi:hypothetical protein H7J71_24425 [Mycolicibacterium peregrinum]|uniref:hypothetical protein n=1 Tax=Mycolicibacterium peregrinum TaxID=43304 RepID=UPI0010556F3C|nr:hypothetical protein [Mycolicibacterium peregrinum]MCV7205158.1 hypothetical protein [Mycolicibacterium peregrinum]